MRCHIPHCLHVTTGRGTGVVGIQECLLCVVCGSRNLFGLLVQVDGECILGALIVHFVALYAKQEVTIMAVT